jgi:hypothetical protein
VNPKKPRTPCLVCYAEPAGPSYKYCSNKCQQEYQYRQYILEWKRGLRSGLSSLGLVTGTIKRYLREKYFNSCSICGWSQIHPVTGEAPLVADHIDGNWRNNCEENLRLLCPNCDALTPTFSALNKGKGRPNRAISKRTLEARELSALARTQAL